MIYTKERTKYLVTFLNNLAEEQDNTYNNTVIREAAKALKVLSAHACCEIYLIDGSDHTYDCENYDDFGMK